MLLYLSEMHPTRSTFTGLAVPAFCFILALFLLSDNQSHPTPGADAVDYYIPKQISYSNTIGNTTNQLIENGLFHTWAPVGIKAARWCEPIIASCPYRFVNDTAGNQIHLFAEGDMPTYAAWVIANSVQLGFRPKTSQRL